MYFEGKEFKEVPGFKDYFVSRDGDVVVNKYYKTPLRRKLQLGTNGYLELNLSIGGGKIYRTGVHRLVALTYLQKPQCDDYLIVNHKNGIKTDNRDENLEWVTYQENAEHAGANNLTTKCRPVAIVTGFGYEVTKFPSIIECARTLGYSKDAVNWRVNTNGKILHQDGLYYMFLEDLDRFFKELNIDDQDVIKYTGKKSVMLMDLTLKTVTVFKSVSEVAEHLKVNVSTVSVWLKKKNQPVLPSLIQLKFSNDKTPWREVKDPLKELSLFTKTKIVLTKSKDGVYKIYSSIVECCKERNITPTCLSYRLKSKGKTLFSDNYYYMYYEDANGPIS